MMNAPLRPGTRPVGAAQLAVKDTSTDGPVFAATYLLTYAPCGALRGALDVALFASSGTVWSRDNLQASRGQWPPPAVRERRANPSDDVDLLRAAESRHSAATTVWSVG